MAQQLQPEGTESGSSVISPSKPAHDAVWDSELFLNQESAQTWACTMCGHVPKKCMADESDKVLCELCSKDPSVKDQKIVHSTFGDKRIGEIKLKCKNKLFTPQPQPPQNEEKKDENAAPAADDACNWTGSVKEWQSHNDNECTFTVKTCEHCKQYNCSKSLINAHYETCPEKSIACSQGCGNNILRKNKDSHIANECMKTILTCTNNGCEVQKEREIYNEHVNEKCDKRIVSCSFRKYGCTKPDIKAEELKQHEDDCKIEHLQCQIKHLQKTLEDQIGIIRMYHGKIDAIPKGYSLCNGQNGTPDLSAQFVQNTQQNNDDNKETDSYALCYIVKVSSSY